MFEETGLDIGGRFDERDCVEIWVKHGVSQKRTKLFFVPGIDTSTEFAPQARKWAAPNHHVLCFDPNRISHHRWPLNAF